MDLITLYSKNLEQQAVYLAESNKTQDCQKQSELRGFALEHERIAANLSRYIASFGNSYLADLDTVIVRAKIERMQSPLKQAYLDALKTVQYEIDDLF